MSDPATEQRPATVADETPEAGYVPPVPIERYLVPGVRALEAVKAQADLLLMLLERAPEDAAYINSAMNTFVNQCNTATSAIHHFQEVRACKGRPQ